MIATLKEKGVNWVSSSTADTSNSSYMDTDLRRASQQWMIGQITPHLMVGLSDNYLANKLYIEFKAPRQS